MRRTGINAQVAELHASQRPARQHPLDRLLHDPFGKLSFKNRTRGTLLDAADVSGVVAVDLVFPLLSGELNLFRVVDDDIIPPPALWGVGRVFLSPPARRANACKPSPH